ncbi:MAG: hypothetical protein GY795_49250 [Desulfobacterales bacterium]|nr:hypothetical protein [Desulfobacterales bacterium]
MAIQLHEFIEQIREELLTPRGTDSPETTYPFLSVDEVELEVSLTVSSKVEGSGKLKIYVVELGGGGEQAHQQAHRVKIKMTPLLTRDEIRDKLKKEGKWEHIESTVMKATTKEGGMVGEEMY